VTWPAGVHFGQPAAGLSAVPYYYPSSPPHSFQAPLPPDHRDSQWITDGILKLQYQKNLGSVAYARLFVYSFYSNWAQNGPMFYGAPGFGSLLTNYDYELSAHTRGAEFKFAAQLSPKHLFDVTMNYVSATTNRYNNNNFLNGPDTDATNLTNGMQCYAYTGGAVSGVAYNAGDAAPCNSDLTSGTFSDPTRGSAPAIGAAGAAGASWRVTYAGYQGFWNTVQPTFTSASIEDLFRPNARLTILAGLRFDRFAYLLADTSGAGRDFWFAAARREFCYNPATNAPVLIPQPPLSFNLPLPFIGSNCPIDASSGVRVQTVHPDGVDGHLLFTNTYDHNLVRTVVQPHLGLTYTLNPDTVLRASYGRYAQGPQSAVVQYNAKDSNLAFPLFQAFWADGFTSPRHETEPRVSNDVDISYERHFKGTDLSLKVTPYYRTVTNEDYSPGFGTLNTGVEQNYGLELEFEKGDFERNGLSWLLAYTYLQTRERFENYPGTSVNPLDPFNDEIAEFNALTKAGGGSPCYSKVGNNVPDPQCGPTSIRNLYYTAARQPLLDRNGWYPTGLNAPYTVPNTLTAIVSYRKGALAITPSLTFNAGTVYGAPTDIVGLDPRTCTQNSRGMTNSPISTVDPLRPDYTSCILAATPTGTLYIPNPASGRFDGFGQYRQPSQININLGVGYDVSAHVKATLTLANVYNRCFGGSRTPWSAAYPPSAVVCAYQDNFLYVSNFYNGTGPNDLGANGVPLNRFFSQPFTPSTADPNVINFAVPFSAYLQVNFKL
jgi:hypothetical protein